MFFEGTAGGHVSKYDSIEAGNAVNDGNWRANVIINVRLANVIIVVISWGENLVTMRLRNGATCIHLISLQFNYWNTHTARFYTLNTFTHCTLLHTAQCTLHIKDKKCTFLLPLVRRKPSIVLV